MDDPDFLPLPEEEQPEKLRKKWEAEDVEEQTEGNKLMACPHCGKWIAKRSFQCLYCGGRVFQNSGLLGRMAGWISGGRIFWLIIAIIIILSFVIVEF